MKSLKCLSVVPTFKNLDNYESFMERLRRTLYYGYKPPSDHPSFPVTDILVNKFGKFCKTDSFDELSLHEASYISYNACITPCSVILALLYLERLRIQSPEYLSSTSSSQVFLISLMVASKFLNDDGEDEEVYNDEWATSAAILLPDLNEAEVKFLKAIDWNLFVDVESFADTLSSLEIAVAKRQSFLHGFFIYSDLVSLSNVYARSWLSFSYLIGSTIFTCIVCYAGAILFAMSCIFLTKEWLSVLNTQANVSLSESSQPVASLQHFTVGLDETIEEDIVTEVNLEESLLGGECNARISGDDGTFRRKSVALRTLTTAMLLASSGFRDNSSWDSFGTDKDTATYFDCNSNPAFVPLWPALNDFEGQIKSKKPMFDQSYCCCLRSGRKRRTRRLHLTSRVNDHGDDIEQTDLNNNQLYNSPLNNGQVEENRDAFLSHHSDYLFHALNSFTELIYDAYLNVVISLHSEILSQNRNIDEDRMKSSNVSDKSSLIVSTFQYTFFSRAPSVSCGKSAISWHVPQASFRGIISSHLTCQT